MSSFDHLSQTNNLYQVLNINKLASFEEIKKAYKKQALKYHPDKNKDKNAPIMFNQISVAYEILSNPESRNKYDTLNKNQHEDLINVILNFVKSSINPENLNKLINILCENNKPDTNNIPEYGKFKKEIEDRLKNKIDLDYINEFMNSLLEAETNDNVKNAESDLSIFICDDEQLPEKKYQLINTVEKSDYSYVDINNSLKYSDTNIDQMNIIGEIKTTLDEVYMGFIKEITVKRQIIENNNIVFKQCKYMVPLINDVVTFQNQGDEYLDHIGKIMAGNLVINIRCKKHNYFKRVNDFDILVSLPLTLFELFNGFKKNFDYFDNQQITLIMTNGFSKIKSNKKVFSQTKFDGNKIIVTLNNLGLIDDKNSRGNLIIYLVLIKKDNFNQVLKNFD
jgi:DnaJ-class molecular chaperone